MIYMVGFRWMFDIYVSLLEGMEWGTLFSKNPNMKNNEGQRFKQPRHARTDHGSSRLDRATTVVGVDGFGKRRLQRIWNLEGSHHVTPSTTKHVAFTYFMKRFANSTMDVLEPLTSATYHTTLTDPCHWGSSNVNGATNGRILHLSHHLGGQSWQGSWTPLTAAAQPEPPEPPEPLASPEMSGNALAADHWSRQEISKPDALALNYA